MARTTTRTNNVTGPTYGASRDLPWNVMGSDLKPAQTKSWAKALAASGLDYDVEVWDSKAVDPLTGRELANPKGRQIVRPTDKGMTVIGQTGGRFTPLQNRDGERVAVDLLGEYGATISGLADFRHGAASILALDLNRPILLDTPDGDQDRTDLTLLVRNSHDGSGALTFALTPMRVRCTNALPAAIRGADRVWKINHTPNAMERVALARESIRLAVGYSEEFAAAAQRMMDTPMVDAEFAKIVAGLWKVEPGAEGKVADRRRATQDEVVALFQASPTMESIRGTRWAGYNALTEYLDHFRPVQGGSEYQQAVARAEGALEGPNVRRKAKLWERFAVAV